MSNPPPPLPGLEPSSGVRQREAVARALADSPVRSTGQLGLSDGRTLDYQVEAGFIAVPDTRLGDSHGQPRAAVFTTAYQLRGATAANRPLCFAFNGGPGASSIFLHLGALGPKRVRVGDDGRPLPPPYAVEDNPQSWLEDVDLVFIDPPHTGYSLTADDSSRDDLLSVDGDVQAMCEVVRGWLTRHQRWSSPVLLCGESYGTTRAAAMAERLASQGVALAGLVLVSCALDFQALDFAPRNDLPFALFLPAFAGVAQHHGCLRGPLAASGDLARQAAQDFVLSDYLAALHQGGRLGEAARRRISRRLAELTGLPQALVERHNLRISDTVFFHELLRPQGQIVGRLDARCTAPMAASQRSEWEFDPSMEALLGPYTAAGMDWFATLGCPSDRLFHPHSEEVFKRWNFNRGEAKGNSFTCTSTDLALVLRRLPHLRVFVASGLFDLATPYSATEWTLDQLDIPATVRPRLTHCHYGAGHMMYTREADLQQLKADVGDWLAPTRSV